MNMQELLFKLEFEACDRWNEKVVQRSREKARLKDTPAALAAQNRKRLKEMKLATVAMQEEIKVKKELEKESTLHAKAAMALREANRTPEQRRERDAETGRMRMLFSRVCPEAAENWREQANLEFQSRYALNRKE
jgi:hypothetical protein